MAAINESSGTDDQLKEVVVAMVPYFEYSHLNQLFVIGRFIASHSIPVHFLCLPEQSQSFKQRVQGGLEFSNIYFDDILPESDEITDARYAGEDVPSVVALLVKLFHPIRRTILELSASAKRLVIIFDYSIGAAYADYFSIPNSDIFNFHPIPAFTRYSFFRQCTDIVDDDHDELIRQLQDDFPTLESSFKPYMVAATINSMRREWKLTSGGLMNSCREVEGKYLDLLANGSTGKPPLFAVGPLHMLLESQKSGSNGTRHECLEFLDKQDVDSVIYVSFGTNATLSQEQVYELALGLEQSNHRFIWALREADKRMESDEKIDENDGKLELPKGFEERVKGRGMVVRNWVPQLEILGHSSTDGFMSHCGWNSCLESISMGVPIAAWPICVDQPYNAVLVTNVLKIGFSVRNWARKEELVTAAAVEKAVKTLMSSAEGEEMRQRAVQLSNKIKSSVGHGGSARKEMESFISYIRG